MSIDGLRPDAIQTFGAAALQRLMRVGSYTLSPSTIHPSKTLPSHTSMLTGQPPEWHGVLWNNVATAEADTVDLPNIFSVARDHGYRTAAFFSKAKFQPLQRDGTLDYSQAPGGWGQGVRPGVLSHLSVRTMDTAATVLWLLGVAEPADWAGAPIVDAFAAVVAD